MKYTLLFLLAMSNLFCWGQTQTSSVDSVTARIRDVYERTENACFELHWSFKSLISPDTLTEISTVHYQRQGAEKRLKETAADGAFVIFDDRTGQFFSTVRHTY